MKKDSFLKKELSQKASQKQDRLASKIVAAIIRWQTCWANKMQRWTEHLSHRGKIVLLFSSSLFTCIISAYLIYRGIMIDSTVNELKPLQIIAPAIRPTPKLLTKPETNNDVAYQRVHGFHEYLDSLSKTAEGHEKLDSLLAARPGLLDSIVLVENIYQSPNKN